MAVEINWGLLQPVDIGGEFARGLEHGKGLARQSAVEGALRDLMPEITGGDPNGALVERGDPEYQARKRRALGALAMYAPQQYQAFAKAQADRDAAGRATAIGELYTKDPQGAVEEAISSGDFDLAKTLQGLAPDKKKAAEDRLKAGGVVAYQALKMPPEQRQAFINSNRDFLIQSGFTEEELANFQPTDAALNNLVTHASTLEQLRGQDKINWNQVGERPSFATDARGIPIGSNNPYAAAVGGGAPPAPAGMPPAANEVGATLSASLPAPVVAGFLGNFHAEGGYGGASGDGGSASGIAQWRGDRQANFQRVIGKPVTDASPAEQAKFVLWEMENPEAAGMTVAQRDAILAAKTPGEAAELIDQFYERSSGEHRPRRVAAANAVGLPPKITGDADYAALPSGTHFIAPDGSERIKP